MVLFAYSVLHLRSAFQGNLEPMTDDLVMSGLYRLVRHPLYLAMVGMSLGLAIGMVSIVGVGVIFLVFLPFCVYRARLEEGFLEAKFGKKWKDYAHRTSFMIPYVY